MCKAIKNFYKIFAVCVLLTTYLTWGVSAQNGKILICNYPLNAPEKDWNVDWRAETGLIPAEENSIEPFYKIRLNENMAEVKAPGTYYSAKKYEIAGKTAITYEFKLSEIISDVVYIPVGFFADCTNAKNYSGIIKTVYIKNGKLYAVKENTHRSDFHAQVDTAHEVSVAICDISLNKWYRVSILMEIDANSHTKDNYSVCVNSDNESYYADNCVIGTPSWNWGYTAYDLKNITHFTIGFIDASSSDSARSTNENGETVYNKIAGMKMRNLSAYNVESFDDFFTVYVSSDAKDEGDGSEEKPLKTLTQALKKIRRIRRNGFDGHMYISLKEGLYNEKIKMTEEDKNISIVSAKEGKAEFCGGTLFESSDFKRFYDEKVLSEIPLEARPYVRRINLSKYGVTDYGTITRVERHLQSLASPPLLTMNKKLKNIAQWPDASFTKAKNVETANGKISFEIEEKNPFRWSKTDGVWIYGMLAYEYADDSLELASFDKNTKRFMTKHTGTYPMAENAQIRFVNILDELNTPGEWYLDRNSGWLYIYPSENTERVSFITETEEFITMNGCKNIEISGISFTENCGSALKISNCDNVLVNNCEFYNIGKQAINISSCVRTTVSDCYLHDLGKGGITISGGDKKNLTPSENLIKNCVIERFSVVGGRYNPAVNLRGTGDTLSHCRISNSPHTAVIFSGNNNVIEYNDIYDVLNETYDAGAIYAGRSWTSGGNVIRYNYIHDLNNHNGGNAIYLDDFMTGTEVYGNVIYNAATGIALHSTQYCNIKNNLIINVRRHGLWLRNINMQPDSYLSAQNSMVSRFIEEGTLAENYTKLEEKSHNLFKDYFEYYDENSEIWNNLYPYLKTIITEGNTLSPKGNVIKNNVIYSGNKDVKIFDISTAAKTLSEIENNLLSVEIPAMQENRNGNLADINEAKKFFESDFVPIDIAECGVENEKTLSAKSIEIIFPLQNAENTAPDDAVLMWENYSGADSYRVVVSENEDMSNPVFDTVTDLSAVRVQNLEYGKKYFWSVCADFSSYLYGLINQTSSEKYSFITKKSNFPLEIDSIFFFDEEGFPTKKFSENFVNTAQCTVHNYGNEEKTASVIMQSFNSEGEEFASTETEITLLPYEVKKVYIGTELPEENGAYMIFAVSENENMKRIYHIKKEFQEIESNDEIIVSDMIFSDLKGNRVYTLQNGQNIVCSMNVENISESDKELTIKLEYSEENSSTESIKEIEFSAGESKRISIDVCTNSSENGYLNLRIMNSESSLYEMRIPQRVLESMLPENMVAAVQKAERKIIDGKTIVNVTLKNISINPISADLFGAKHSEGLTSYIKSFAYVPGGESFSFSFEADEEDSPAVYVWKSGTMIPYMQSFCVSK